MINKKKTQMSIVESVFMIMLFIAFTTYYSYDVNVLVPEQDYTFTVNSAVDSIYYSNDYRVDVFTENLTNSAVSSAKWSGLNQTLSKMFYNFEVVIRENNNSKTIFSCKPGMYSKMFSERMMFCGNDFSNCNFRALRVGVCY